MATRIFIGAAKPVAQVSRATPANVAKGDVFTLTINQKDVSFTATDSTVANVVAGLLAAWNAVDNTAANTAQIPEFTEITAANQTTYLELTGRSAGVPFTVTSATTSGDDFSVSVNTLQAGSAGTNEKQIVTLPGTPTGGDFTLSFKGITSGVIAYNASAATFETAFEAMSSVGAGNGTVTGDAGGPWTIEFTGTLAGAPQPLVTGNGASITGAAAIEIKELQEGGLGTNEVQTLTDPNTLHAFQLVYTDQAGLTHNTHWLANEDGNLTAADVQTALEALAYDSGEKVIGTNNVLVTGDAGGPWTITFVGDLAAQDIPLMTIGTTVYTSAGVTAASSTVSTTTVTATTAGSTTDVPEKQVIRLLHGPTGGTFTLSWEGETTGALTFDESAADIETALEAFTDITAVTVTGNNGGPWTVQFDTPSGDVSLLTAANSLTGSSVGVVTTQQGSAAQNEIQQVSLIGNPSGGTFTLTWDPGGGDETTAAIDYDDPASDVRTALGNLTTPAITDFSVTGPDGGPWLVEFIGTYADTNVNEMTGDSSLTGGGTQTLTMSTPTAATGPEHWDNADNWSGGAVPVSGDDVVFADNDKSCRYGIDQSGMAGTLTSLTIYQSWTGHLGLPEINQGDSSISAAGGYREYRDTAAQLKVTTVRIGQGGGTGSQFINLDSGGTTSTVTVHNTSNTPLSGHNSCVFWIGTSASNAIHVTKGRVSIAGRDGETVNATSLDTAYLNDIASDAQVIVGKGASITTIHVGGGVFDIDGASGNTVTTFNAEAGTVNITGASPITTLNCSGSSTVNHKGTGTVTTANVSSGSSLSLNGTQESITVTNVNVYGTGKFTDTYRRATLSNGINCQRTSLAGIDIGEHINVAITAL